VDKTFSDSYEQFVRGIALPAPTPQQKQLADAYSKASDAYAAVVEKKKDEWLKYDAQQRHNPPATWTSRQNWYQLHAAAALTVAQNDLANAYSAYFSSLDATSVIYAKEIKKIDTAQHIDIVMPASAQNFNASDDDPTSWTTDSVWPWAFDSGALSNLVAAGEAQVKAGTLATTWTFDNSSESRDEDRKSWSASASYGMFFHASVTHNETSINFKSAGTYLKFGYYSIAQVPVVPSKNWYSANLLSDFACGPFKASAHTKPTDWWGADGKLSVIPVSVVVAYRPDIEAVLTNAQYNFFESATSGGGGLSIGPFGIGGGGSSLHQHIDKNQNTGHIHITTESQTPTVIGIIYQKLGKTNCPSA
jgi:hypothetical protein